MEVRKARWKESRGPGSSVGLLQEYDTIMSPDNRRMNLNETCLDDVKKKMIMWSEDKFWKARSGREARI